MGFSTRSKPTQNLSLQIRASRADNVLEVGNLGGYSAIWMSITVEVDTHHNAVAKRSIANANLSSQIDVLLGRGTKFLAKLQPEIAAGQRKLFDWVFIDADKQNDLACLQMVLEMTEQATTFFIDDVVRNGKLADRKAAKKDDRVRGTREQVEAIGKDERVKAVVV